jgi:hypothetical protein
VGALLLFAGALQRCERAGAGAAFLVAQRTGDGELAIAAAIVAATHRPGRIGTLDLDEALGLGSDGLTARLFRSSDGLGRGRGRSLCGRLNGRRGGLRRGAARGAGAGAAASCSGPQTRFFLGAAIVLGAAALFLRRFLSGAGLAAASLLQLSRRASSASRSSSPAARGATGCR